MIIQEKHIITGGNFGSNNSIEVERDSNKAYYCNNNANHNYFNKDSIAQINSNTGSISNVPPVVSGNANTSHNKAQILGELEGSTDVVGSNNSLPKVNKEVDAH